jgi:hypothetical protein
MELTREELVAQVAGVTTALSSLMLVRVFDNLARVFPRRSKVPLHVQTQAVLAAARFATKVAPNDAVRSDLL